MEGLDANCGRHAERINRLIEHVGVVEHVLVMMRGGVSVAVMNVVEKKVERSVSAMVRVVRDRGVLRSVDVLTIGEVDKLLCAIRDVVGKRYMHDIVRSTRNDLCKRVMYARDDDELVSDVKSWKAIDSIKGYHRIMLCIAQYVFNRDGIDGMCAIRRVKDGIEEWKGRREEASKWLAQCAQCKIGR